MVESFSRNASAKKNPQKGASAFDTEQIVRLVQSSFSSSDPGVSAAASYFRPHGSALATGRDGADDLTVAAHNRFIATLDRCRSFTAPQPPTFGSECSESHRSAKDVLQGLFPKDTPKGVRNRADVLTSHPQFQGSIAQSAVPDTASFIERRPEDPFTKPGLRVAFVDSQAKREDADCGLIIIPKSPGTDLSRGTRSRARSGKCQEVTSRNVVETKIPSSHKAARSNANVNDKGGVRNRGQGERRASSIQRRGSEVLSSCMSLGCFSSSSEENELSSLTGGFPHKLRSKVARGGSVSFSQSVTLGNSASVDGSTSGHLHGSQARLGSSLARLHSRSGSLGSRMIGGDQGEGEEDMARSSFHASRQLSVSRHERERLKVVALYQQYPPNIDDFMTYDYRKVLRVLKKRPHLRTAFDVQAVFQHLGRLGAFAKLSQFVLRDLIAGMYIDEFEEGAFVFKQGDAGTAWYVILWGGVEVLVSVNGSLTTMERAATLSAGAGFGDLALLLDKPRSATIVAITRTILIRIEKEVYQRVMKQHHVQALQAKVHFLQKIHPFDTWPEATMKNVAEVIQWKTFEAGQDVIEEGDATTCMYFVRSGKVDLFKLLPVHQAAVGGNAKGDECDQGGSVGQLRSKSSRMQVLVGTVNEGEYFNENLVIEKLGRAKKQGADGAAGVAQDTQHEGAADEETDGSDDDFKPQLLVRRRPIFEPSPSVKSSANAKRRSGVLPPPPPRPTTTRGGAKSSTSSFATSHSPRIKAVSPTASGLPPGQPGSKLSARHDALSSDDDESENEEGVGKFVSNITAKVRGPEPAELGSVSIPDAKAKLYMGLTVKPIYHYSNVVLEELAAQQQEALRWQHTKTRHMNELARERLHDPHGTWQAYLDNRKHVFGIKKEESSVRMQKGTSPASS